jgi:7-carboxy-7-deazaguanine synthase
MQITEIFRSIQGESSFAGLPFIFVRLTGCNLRCSWCDTEYSFTGGQKMSLDQVMGEVQRFSPVKLVEVTGGEPMLQKNEAIPLMRRLLASGYQVLLETSGERPLAEVPREVIKIVDVKCPASGEAGSFDLGNLQALTAHDEVKFVISDRQDYDFACDFIREQGLEKLAGNLIFSPAFRQDAEGIRDSSNCLLDPRQLADWILEDGLPVRLGLQIHKFIWQPETKGV